MKIKVSDYIAQFLIENDITHVFTVVGGGAMHLNDSFGHHEKLQSIYHHHEQGAAIAAEAYARINGNMAALCVTSGPGAINALNGVVGAYQDSIPMMIFSGQTKSSMTVKYSGLNLRTLGNQEFDIVSALDNMVKYSEMIMEPKKIRYCLEKAYYIALNGRPGPCWLDIPLDIQGAYVETDELEPYTAFETQYTQTAFAGVENILVDKLEKAERPVIYAGNGIRIAGAVEKLHRAAAKYNIPIVTCWDSIDLVADDDRLYCGRGGTMGNRAGNFAVQNSDLLICIGSRLNIYQVGYNVKTWARAAYTVVVDIDAEELKKPTIRVDLPVCADAGDFLDMMLALHTDAKAPDKWCRQCVKWKEKYPVVLPEYYNNEGLVNPYVFMHELGRQVEEEALTVVSNGSACVVGSQSYYIKPNDRFIMNCGLSSMGYGLPAAIGACIGANKGMTICIEGDGSIMMNLQELQTVVTNKLPIKIFILNNNGYHQIRQTQNNIFHNGLIGVGPESGDLGFPDFSKLALAFGLEYMPIRENSKVIQGIKKVICNKTIPTLCEVFVDINQKFEPKSATKKLADGTLVSPPLEDLAPFLSREELEANMYIPLI